MVLKKRADGIITGSDPGHWDAMVDFLGYGNIRYHADWLLFKLTGTYYAQNGETGELDYSSVDLVTVWDNIIDDNTHIHFRSGTFQIDDSLDIQAKTNVYVSFGNSIIEQTETDKSIFKLTGATNRTRFQGPATLWHETGATPTAGACFELGDGVNGLHRTQIQGFWLGGGDGDHYVYRGFDVEDNVYNLKVADIKADEHVSDLIKIQGGNDHYFTRVNADNAQFPDDGSYPLNGNGDGCSNGSGAYIIKTEGTWFTDCDFVKGTHGVLIEPSGGVNNAHYIWFNDCAFDSAVEDACLITTTNSTGAAADHVYFNGCWFGGGSNVGLNLDHTGTGQIHFINGVNCLFIGNYNEGMILTDGCGYIGFTNCNFTANDQTGGGAYDLEIEDGVDDWRFTECIWHSADGVNINANHTNFRLTGQNVNNINYPALGARNWNNYKVDLW